MELILQKKQDISEAAAFDFAYFIYISTAACIAAAGLVMNNSEIIVASMLISPIMVHVNAVTFGSLSRDARLVQRGSIGIAVGSLIGTSFGALAGLYFSPTMVLTDEMLARTMVVNLKWSFLVAFLSGLAAGVSLLQTDATGNLIGVAISTSVLPPIVNFGLLLPNAIYNRPNGVSVHACARSAAMAIGNILIIVVSSAASIQAYMRLLNCRSRTRPPRDIAV